MQAAKRILTLIKILAVAGSLLVTVLFLGKSEGNARDIQQSFEANRKLPSVENLPYILTSVISQSHGNYDGLIDHNQLVRDLSAVDIVLIGEALRPSHHTR